MNFLLEISRVQLQREFYNDNKELYDRNLQEYCRKCRSHVEKNFRIRVEQLKEAYERSGKGIRSYTLKEYAKKRVEIRASEYKQMGGFLERRALNRSVWRFLGLFFSGHDKEDMYRYYRSLRKCD